jgi:peroxiredoxin
VVKELAAKLAVDFPLLADRDRAVIKSYGVEDAENEIAWPAMFVIRKDGKIAKRLMLDNYKERPPTATLVEALEAAAKP